MTKQLIKTEDLGADWFVDAWDDGSFTLRGSKGEDVELARESAAQFVALWNLAQEDAYQHARV